MPRRIAVGRVQNTASARIDAEGRQTEARDHRNRIVKQHRAQKAQRRRQRPRPPHGQTRSPRRSLEMPSSTMPIMLTT